MARYAYNLRLCYAFRECSKLYTSNYEIIHGFRQKNMVNGCLGDAAYSHKRRMESFRDEDLPKDGSLSLFGGSHGFLEFSAIIVPWRLLHFLEFP